MTAHALAGAPHAAPPRVYFEVVPVKADATGNRAARLEIWLVDAAGRDSNVYLYDVDSARHTDHRRGRHGRRATLPSRTATDDALS